MIPTQITINLSLKIETYIPLIFNPSGLIGYCLTFQNLPFEFKHLYALRYCRVLSILFSCSDSDRYNNCENKLPA